RCLSDWSSDVCSSDLGNGSLTNGVIFNGGGVWTSGAAAVNFGNVNVAAGAITNNLTTNATILANSVTVTVGSINFSGVGANTLRSEERRVGKEGTARG